MSMALKRWPVQDQALNTKTDNLRFPQPQELREGTEQGNCNILWVKSAGSNSKAKGIELWLYGRITPLHQTPHKTTYLVNRTEGVTNVHKRSHVYAKSQAPTKEHQRQFCPLFCTSTLRGLRTCQNLNIQIKFGLKTLKSL